MILVWAKRVLNCDHIRSLNLMCCLNAPPDSRRVKSPKPSESPSNSCEAKKGITRSQDNGGNSQQKKKSRKNSHVMADNKDNKALTGIFFVFYY